MDDPQAKARYEAGKRVGERLGKRQSRAKGSALA